MKLSKYQNTKSLHELPGHWKLLEFNEILMDVTKTGTKILSSNYEKEGLYPIIDQGKSLVAGYSNLDNPINGEKIIFGDHTRNLKFIDFDKFHIGADGVKVLENKMPDEVVTKYIYLYLSSVQIPNTGYNRHFKYLKEIVIPIPNIEIQREIVTLFDKLSEIICRRKSQITALDKLTQSLFLEMFGDPINNEKNWNRVVFGDLIESLTDYHANGSYKVLKANVELLDKEDFALMVRTTDLENNNFVENVKYISEDAYHFLKKSKIHGGEIIINKIGSAGNVYLMPKLNRPVSLGMNQFSIRINDRAINKFVYFLLASPKGQKLIKSRVQGAVTKSITKDAVREIPLILPPIELQQQYCEKVEQIELYKQKLLNAVAIYNDLYNSLLQKVFKGELFQDQSY